MHAGPTEALRALLRNSLSATRSRRAAFRLLGGLGLAGFLTRAEARKRRKKRCAKAGQKTGKKRKRFAPG
jgi:hypothetical protein